MAEFTLVIGNRNYSSWSLRGWLMTKHAEIDFDEVVIPLDEPSTKADIARHSPSGTVPVLVHRGLAIWESLAIGEYLAELKPEARMWPEAPAARAVARAVSAEMHAGFAAMRNAMPMNIRASYPGRTVAPEVQGDVQRVLAIWRDCRKRFAGSAPRDDGFLFGSVSIADAMFAPVISRFITYAVTLDEEAKRYCDTVLAWPAMREWVDAAKHESWMIPKYELS
jgi:glutathione S-transferase